LPPPRLLLLWLDVAAAAVAVAGAVPAVTTVATTVASTAGPAALVAVVVLLLRPVVSPAGWLAGLAPSFQMRRLKWLPPVLSACCSAPFAGCRE
jgi:hypothetical protein